MHPLLARTIGSNRLWFVPLWESLPARAANLTMFVEWPFFRYCNKKNYSAVGHWSEKINSVEAIEQRPGSGIGSSGVVADIIFQPASGI